MTTTPEPAVCGARHRDAVGATLECELPAGHDGTHEAHTTPDQYEAWADTHAEAPTTNPCRADGLHRFATHDIEVCDRDRARAAAERAAHEEHRRDLANALGLADAGTWPDMIGQVRVTRQLAADAVGLPAGSLWGAIVDRAAAFRAAAMERADLLTEARDALEAAGQTGAHGDDSPAITPAIVALAADVKLLRGNSEVDRREASRRRETLAGALGLDTDAGWDAITGRARQVAADLDAARAGDVPWIRAHREDLEDAKKHAKEAEATIARVRDAVTRVRDAVTDWQRGHRACSIIVLDALDGEHPDADSEPATGCEHRSWTRTQLPGMDDLGIRGPRVCDDCGVWIDRPTPQPEQPAEPETDCPGHETSPNACTCTCEGCRHNCAAHQPAAPDPQPREVCCVCGCPDVTYHNYREQPFCADCANGLRTHPDPEAVPVLDTLVTETLAAYRRLRDAINRKP